MKQSHKVPGKTTPSNTRWKIVPFHGYHLITCPDRRNMSKIMDRYRWILSHWRATWVLSFYTITYLKSYSRSRSRSHGIHHLCQPSNLITSRSHHLRKQMNKKNINQEMSQHLSSFLENPWLRHTHKKLCKQTRQFIGYWTSNWFK